MGVMQYLTHSYSYNFDMFITIGCMISHFPGFTNSGLSVLRVFRLMRVLRMLRLGARMKSMVKMVNMIRHVLEPTFHVSILLMLFMIVFAILGVQVFAVKECAECCSHPNFYMACGDGCEWDGCPQCEECTIVSFGNLAPSSSPPVPSASHCQLPFSLPSVRSL